MRYADALPDVLANINVTIEPGQRIGIVGASGAGKSTFVTMLFRFRDPNSEGGAITHDDSLAAAAMTTESLRRPTPNTLPGERDGTVVIDGYDVRDVPLQVIRRNIAIVPQEPVLFSGESVELSFVGSTSLSHTPSCCFCAQARCARTLIQCRR